MSTLPDGTQVSTDVLGDVAGIETRLKVMDLTGIDMRVLSLRNPGVEEFETSAVISTCRRLCLLLCNWSRQYTLCRGLSNRIEYCGCAIG
jgi:hypothetical protein